MKAYGVDLSKHNGVVDFNKLKEDGNSFVILRAGYGTGTKDSKFEEYYKQAKECGFHVGAYWYSYALTEKDAEKEVEKFLKTVKGKTFEYPLFVDMEDADGWKNKHGMPSSATLTDICKKFCSMLENSGYYAGIYASESWFKNQLKGINNDRYDRWIANWGANNGKVNSDKSKECKLHQFTSKYTLGGKVFDQNICYYDYPTVIKNKGLNGYSKGSTSTSQSKPTTSTNRLDTLSDEQVASEIISGKGNWGSGNTRKQKLGSRYASIQAIVNKKLGATSTPKKELKVGSSIKIKKGAKDLNTKTTYASFVYNTTYKVIKIVGNDVVFGKNGVATGKVNKANIILQ